MATSNRSLLQCSTGEPLDPEERLLAEVSTKKDRAAGVAPPGTVSR
jgi:hypothetical protein